MIKWKSALSYRALKKRFMVLMVTNGNEWNKEVEVASLRKT